MSPTTATIVVAVLSLIGTLVGTLGGIMASSKMTNYRLSQLEERVGKHNNLIERTYKLEEKQSVYEEVCRDESPDRRSRKGAKIMKLPFSKWIVIYVFALVTGFIMQTHTSQEIKSPEYHRW